MMDTIVDKLLLQAIESNKVKIKEYEVQRIQLQTQMDILHKENEEYLDKYREMCSHIGLIVKEVTGSSAGGYYDKSYTEYSHICSRCRKVLRVENVVGSYA